MPVAAIVGSAVVGAGASVYGAHQAAGAADRASRRGRDATMEMYTQGRADQAPYREAGYRALGEVGDLYLGSDAERRAAMGRFETSPQYEFVRDQGIEGLTNSASARGGQLSGNALRGATSFSSGLASGEFNNYVDRLMGVAGLGANTVSQGVQAGGQAGNQLSQIYANEGQARGSAYLAGATGVNSAIQGGLQNWAFNQYMGGGAGSPGFNPAAATAQNNDYINRTFG